MKALLLLLAAMPIIAQQTIDNSTASAVIPWTVRANFPGVCKYGQMVTLSSGVIGSNIYECGLSNTWTATSSTSSQNLRSISITFTGNGSALSGTSTNCHVIPSSGTIQSAYTDADSSGSVTVAISTTTYATWISSGDAGFSGYTSIVASAPPSLSSAIGLTQPFALTGWTTALIAGQVLCVQITNPSTIKRVEVVLIYAAN